MVMVPYLLQFGLDNSFNTKCDELGVVDAKNSRSKTKQYIRVRAGDDNDYYNMDLKPGAYLWEDFEGYAVAAILSRAWDWGDLAAHAEELAKGLKNGNSILAGITYVPGKEVKGAPDGTGLCSYDVGGFEFDPETITVEAATNFLAIIGGKLRLAY